MRGTEYQTCVHCAEQRALRSIEHLFNVPSNDSSVASNMCLQCAELWCLRSMEQCAERFNECYSISPHRTPSDALRTIPENETMCLAQAKMTHITHMTNFMGYLITQSPYFFDQRLFQIRVLFFNIIGLIKDSFFHQGLLDEKSKPGLIKDFFSSKGLFFIQVQTKSCLISVSSLLAVVLINQSILFDQRFFPLYWILFWFKTSFFNRGLLWPNFF